MNGSIEDFSALLKRNLIFVSGKGGVGKTVLSQAIAKGHADLGKGTLWCTFEDPLMPVGEMIPVSPTLTHLNIDPSIAFEEYASLLLGGFAKLFIRNSLIRKLSRLAPGIRELVMLGKVWHERENFQQIVIDMPSTGYGLAMFQSVQNFKDLFSGGVVFKDAEKMMATLQDPLSTAHILVTLPEEMPMREALDLQKFLDERFPKNRSTIVVNRCLDYRMPNLLSALPKTTPTHLSTSSFISHRAQLEYANIEELKTQTKTPVETISFVLQDEHSEIVEGVCQLLKEKGLSK